jgi:hypothetical protein
VNCISSSCYYTSVNTTHQDFSLSPTKNPVILREHGYNFTMTERYVFDSFLPYLESIQLSRGVSGLLRLQGIIGRGTHTPQQLYMRTYFNLSAIFPSLVNPAENNQRLRQILEAQLSHGPTDAESVSRDRQAVHRLLDALSPVEWQELRQTSHVSQASLVEFIDESREMLKKLTAPLRSGISLLEDLTLEAVNSQEGKRLARLLEVWEQAKMAHEGYPPYFDKLTERVVKVMRSLDSKFQPPSLSARHSQPLSSRRINHAQRILADGQKRFPHIITAQSTEILLGAIDPH